MRVGVEAAKTLLEAIETLRERRPGPGEHVASSLSQAMAADPNRVSVPIKAAVIRPRDYICTARAKVL